MLSPSFSAVFAAVILAGVGNVFATGDNNVCTDHALIDFESDEYGSPLELGDVIDGSVQLPAGLKAEARRSQRGPNGRFLDGMIFDTRHVTGRDFDLAKDPNQKNILIISADNDTNDPDDAGRGGLVRFVFDPPVALLESLKLIDVEHGAIITIMMSNGGEAVIDIPAGLEDGNIMTAAIDASNVKSFTVKLPRGGAIDDISVEVVVDCEPTSSPMRQPDVPYFTPYYPTKTPTYYPTKKPTYHPPASPTTLLADPPVSPTTLLAGPPEGLTPGIFNSKNASQSTTHTMSAVTIVNVFAEAVLRTGSFPASIDGAPNLGRHQSESKDVCQSWIDSVRGQIYQANADLGAYAEKFQHFYTQLSALAKDLTDENKVTFTQGLHLLQSDLAMKYQTSTAALSAIQDFNKALTTAVADLTTDNKNINATYEGDEGELANLQEEIDSANKARQSDLEIIAVGATGAVVSGLMITVGVLAEIETAGASTALVVAGIGGEIGAGVTIGIAAKDISKQDKIIADDTAKLKELTAEIALIGTVTAQITQLLAKGKDAEDALNGLTKQWQVMDAQLSDTIDAVDGMSVSDGPWLQAELDTANADWKKTQSTVDLITHQLVNIPVQNVGTPVGTSPLLPALLGGSPNQRSPTALATTAPVSSSASASSNAVVSALRAIDSNVAKISASSANPPPMVSQAQPQLQAVVDAASVVNDTCAAVVEDLCYISTNWLPPLTAIATGQNPDLSQAREAVHGLSMDLATAASDIELASRDSSVLHTAATTAIAQLTNVANSLSSEDSSLQASIASMQNDVRSLNAKIAEDRQKEDWGWILGPVGYVIAREIGDLADDVSDKNNVIQNDKMKISSDEQVVAAIGVAHTWCATTSTYANTLATEVNGLLSAVQALHAELDAAASDANRDDLFAGWVSSQVGAIVGALHQLAQPATTDYVFATVHPAMTTKAVRALSTEGYSSAVLAESLGNMTASLITTSSAANLIIQQQKLDFPLVPTVATDQAVLQTTCRNWITLYRPTVINVITSTNEASNFVQRIISETLNATSTDQMSQGMLIAKSRLQSLEHQVEDAYRTLTRDFLRLELEKDTARFGVDQIQVADKYNGTNGVLAQIRNQIEAHQDEINAYNAKLAQGASNAVVTALTAELVIAVTLVTAQVTLPAAAAGAGELTVLMYKAASAAVENGSAIVRKKATDKLLEALGGEEGEQEGQAVMDELRSLVIEQGKLQSTLVSFSVVAEQLDMLEATSKDLERAVDMIPYEIDAFIREINLLLVMLGTSTVDLGIVKEKLAALETAFNTLETVSDNLLRSYLASD